MGLCCAWVLASNVTHSSTFANYDDAQIKYAKIRHSAQMRCKDLVSTSNFNYTIIAASEIAATESIPIHCRVSGLVASEVRFEVNLPLKWNARIYMFGNGGLAGTPAIDPLKQFSRNQALMQNFVTVYTDTGHDRRVEPGGTFAHNNFHKLVDYGFRAVHLTIASAKAIVQDFYANEVSHSYWHGCSTGGRQGMISAQRFPNDFDGIIAGAPAANYSGLKFSQAWRVAAISRSGLTEEEVLVLADHIYRQCDNLDGVADGLIADPRRCDFDPNRDLPKCKGQDKVDCFDKQEISSLTQYYAPVVIGDEKIYPAMPVGSEVLGLTYSREQRSGWFPWLINDQGPTLLDQLGSDFFRYMAYIEDRPEYDWTEFEFEMLPDNIADFRAIVDATDPDLSAFKNGGGKLLSYFGWADPDINPLTLIDYHNQVKSLDVSVDDYFRVFLMPGLFHCQGGAGPDQFDVMTPLIDWVEGGMAPDQVKTWKLGKGNQRLDQRPVCAYPTQATRQNSTQNSEQAHMFACATTNSQP